VSEDGSNVIEAKLKNLLEETRRKLNHFENDEESPISDEQMTGSFGKHPQA